MRRRLYERTEGRQATIRKAVEQKQPDLAVVLENIHDPHNMMAVLRSCESVGVLDAYIIDSKPGRRAYQRKPEIGKRSSSGAKKWVNLKVFKDTASCLNSLKNEGFRILTTKMEARSESLYELDLTQKVALVFGNEIDGISEEAHAMANGNYLIPQMGMSQSLNISVACAVSLFEACRQRIEKGYYDSPRLAPDALEELYQDWITR